MERSTKQLRIDERTHRGLKILSAIQGRNMLDIANELIKDAIDKHNVSVTEK